MNYQHILDRISETPHLWNILRRIVEDGFRGEKRLIEQELAPWRDVGQREFLDLGCGTGEFAPCFPAAHYTGVDISPVYIRFAANTYARRFLTSSGAHLALPDQHFDAALVLGVLHHLPDELVRTAMQELHRVLRPGATVLVMEDIPPPDAWNIAGHAMHWLDRGGYIRSEADYRNLFGTGFAMQRTGHMRSGICDYGVYVLERSPEPELSSNDARNSDTCLHDEIIVDYLAASTDSEGVPVRDLQDTDPEDTRPIMQLLNPRCAECGTRLNADHLMYRIRPGGDLHDARFQWIWDASHPEAYYSSGEAPFR